VRQRITLGRVQAEPRESVVALRDLRDRLVGAKLIAPELLLDTRVRLAPYCPPHRGEARVDGELPTPDIVRR